jgi:hypothetical protein
MAVRMAFPNETARVVTLCALLVALVVVAFAPAVRGGFVLYDDEGYVTDNSQVQTGVTLQSVAWAFTSLQESNWHPVTWLSHMLDCELFGLKAWGHHLTSVSLHAGNSLLLFLLLRRLTGATWPSFFAAALFGVHPLRVESVAWVSERKDVLSGLFFLLTVWSYVVYVDSRKVQSSNHLPPPTHDPAEAEYSIDTARPASVTRLLPCSLGLPLCSRPDVQTNAG